MSCDICEPDCACGPRRPTADHLYTADERVWTIPDATREQWEAATAYVQRHAEDLLPMLGMGGAA